MNPLRIAIIGGGHLGRIHTKILQNNSRAELVAVAESDAATRLRLEQEFGVNVCEDYRQVIKQIDGAIIATPTAAHYPIAVDLLDHGVHTFIEKPITNTTPQADHLIHTADRQKLVLQVGHVERFNPAFEQAAARLPRPRYIEAHRMSTYTFRSTDVGVVMDLMIHDIDLVSSLVNSPLIDTRAVGVAVFGPHEDIAQARLEFADGTVANLTASRCSFQPMRNISWFSETGYVAADLSTGKLQSIYSSSLIDTSINRDIATLSETQQQQIREELFDSVLPLTSGEVRSHNAIEQEQIDFLNAIVEGRQPRVCGRDGRRAVSIAQSIIEAVMNHRWQDGHLQRAGAQAQRIKLLPDHALLDSTGRRAG